MPPKAGKTTTPGRQLFLFKLILMLVATWNMEDYNQDAELIIKNSLSKAKMVFSFLGDTD